MSRGSAASEGGEEILHLHEERHLAGDHADGAALRERLRERRERGSGRIPGAEIDPRAVGRRLGEIEAAANKDDRLLPPCCPIQSLIHASVSRRKEEDHPDIAPFVLY
jgi:hypothetical protein